MMRDYVVQKSDVKALEPIYGTKFVNYWLEQMNLDEYPVQMCSCAPAFPFSPDVQMREILDLQMTVMTDRGFERSYSKTINFAYWLSFVVYFCRNVGKPCRLYYSEFLFHMFEKHMWLHSHSLFDAEAFFSVLDFTQRVPQKSYYM